MEEDGMTAIKFPNTSWRAIDPALMMAKFGARMKMLAPMALGATSIRDIPRETYPYIPQSDAAWMSLRQMPRLTASNGAKWAGMHDKAVAEELKLSETMWETSPTNTDWDNYALRRKHGLFPTLPFSSPGAFFAKGGTMKEDNVLAVFMDQNPGAFYEDRGLTLITDDDLKARKLFDAFGDGYLPRTEGMDDFFNEEARNDCMGTTPLWPFPVEVGASPDGIVTLPDGEVVAVEWKCPSVFIPEGKSKFPGATFFFCSRKTWDQPPTYYLPQLMMQMLALGLDSVLFGVYTYEKGMKVWRVNFDREYASLLMSVIKYNYSAFVAYGRPVPREHFLTTINGHHRRVYKRLIKLTIDMCAAAPLWAFYDGEVTKRVTDELCTQPWDHKFVLAPNVPEETPPHMALYAYYLHAFGEADALVWISKHDEIAARRANLQAVCSLELLFFVTPMMYTLESPRDYPGGKDHPDYHNIALLSKVHDRMEAYLVTVFQRIVRHISLPADVTEPAALAAAGRALYLSAAKHAGDALCLWFSQDGERGNGSLDARTQHLIKYVRGAHPFTRAWAKSVHKLCRRVADAVVARGHHTTDARSKLFDPEIYPRMLGAPEYYLPTHNVMEAPTGMTHSRIVAAVCCVEDLLRYFPAAAAPDAAPDGLEGPDIIPDTMDEDEDEDSKGV